MGLATPPTQRGRARWCSEGLLAPESASLLQCVVAVLAPSGLSLHPSHSGASWERRGGARPLPSLLQPTLE